MFESPLSNPGFEASKMLYIGLLRYHTSHRIATAAYRWQLNSKATAPVTKFISHTRPSYLLYALHLWMITVDVRLSVVRC